MVKNASVEAEKKTRTIKEAVQRASGNRNPKTFMGIISGNHSKQIDGLGSTFQYDESNYIIAEAMEEYILASTKAA